MDVDWNAEIVEQIDSHWRHQLRPRLDGLTDHELRWQPAGEQPVTTIAWRLAHLTEGLEETNVAHFGGAPAPVDPEGTAEEALRRFDAAFEHWLRGVRGLGTAGLAGPQGPTSPAEFAEAPMCRLILFTSVEIIHHGAEICLLRDLYLHDGVAA